MPLFLISLHVKDGSLLNTLMYHVLLHLHLLSPGNIKLVHCRRCLEGISPSFRHPFVT